jgi:hypothetical protein
MHPRVQDIRLRNPYDCPEVMKAVIQDIVGQIQAIFAFELASPSTVGLAQMLVDRLADKVEFRGTGLNKLVSIQLFMSPTDYSTLNFSLRPLSEDGRHLLRIISDEPAFPATSPPKMTVVDPPKTVVRRIVEI